MEIDKREEVQDEAFSICIDNHRTGLAMSVGSGKTRVGLRHMNHMLKEAQAGFFVEFLIVASKKSIFEEWKKEMKKAGYEELINHVVFSTYRSINKQDPTRFTAVYLDECHNLLASHLPFLSEYKGVIIGLTGTPPRYKNSEKGRLLQVYCPIRYSYITDDAVADNVLNDYNVIIHPISLSTEKNHKVENKKTGGHWYTSEVANYDYWNQRIANSHYGKSQMMTRVMRMKSMQEYQSKEEYAKNLLQMIDGKCIVFANTTAQADRLCKHSYHSKNPDSIDNLKLFENEEIDELSCVLQLSEGINVPNLKSAIILHAYGNEKKLMQRLGRLMRLDPGETAFIHVLMYEDTQDVQWVMKATQDLDQSKIIYFS